MEIKDILITLQESIFSWWRMEKSYWQSYIYSYCLYNDTDGVTLWQQLKLEYIKQQTIT